MFTLPVLRYQYNSLEPYIDEATMRIHHTKHHQAYVDNLNKALEKYPDFYKKPIEEILSDLEAVPEDIRMAVINNGGGHANHSLFWEIMAPNPKKQPEGALLDAINSTFGSLLAFKEQFTQKAMGVFGSGWAFLIVTPERRLSLKRHSFQNSPISHGNIPILGIDVWEHAYYLKYQNRRAEYIDAWWNVVNWEEVENRFKRSLHSS
jgi:Fe-Mn family superoxide dismutase